MRQMLVMVFGLAALQGCTKSEPLKSEKKASEATRTVSKKSSTEASASRSNAAPQGKKISAAPAMPAPGELAPDFRLTSYQGEAVQLSSLKGSVVVLEWFNPECPFVKYAYNEGPMKKLISESRAKGVVWIGINSGALGNQGHGKDTNLNAMKAWGLTHAVCPDESGEVGQRYGATRTPEVVVIDKAGKIAYRGALDSSRGATPEPEDSYTNYAKQAIWAALEGKPQPDAASTKPWGCTVKYAR